MADVRDVPGTAMYGPESARLQGTSSRLPNTVSWTSPLPETPLSGQSSSLPADMEYKETEAQDPSCLFAISPNSSRNRQCGPTACAMMAPLPWWPLKCHPETGRQ